MHWCDRTKEITPARSPGRIRRWRSSRTPTTWCGRGTSTRFGGSSSPTPAVATRRGTPSKKQCRDTSGKAWCSRWRGSGDVWRTWSRADPVSAVNVRAWRQRLGVHRAHRARDAVDEGLEHREDRVDLPRLDLVSVSEDPAARDLEARAGRVVEQPLHHPGVDQRAGERGIVGADVEGTVEHLRLELDAGKRELISCGGHQRLGPDGERRPSTGNRDHGTRQL